MRFHLIRSLVRVVAPIIHKFASIVTSPSSDYSKAAAFDDPLTPVATAIDIKAKYDAKCGAPSAGYPKVFFKYFYVNTATGEKSGEKMASAVLSE